MKNHDAFTVIFFFVVMFIVLAVNSTIPIWKYKTCKKEGLSTPYCISRLF